MFLTRAQDGISLLVKRDRTSTKNDRGLHLRGRELAAFKLAVWDRMVILNTDTSNYVTLNLWGISLGALFFFLNHLEIRYVSFS